MRADQLEELASTDAEHASVEKFREVLEKAISEMRAEKTDDTADEASSDHATTSDESDSNKDSDNDSDVTE